MPVEDYSTAYTDTYHASKTDSDGGWLRRDWRGGR